MDQGPGCLSLSAYPVGINSAPITCGPTMCCWRCGSITCKKCMELISFPLANKLTVPARIPQGDCWESLSHLHSTGHPLQSCVALFRWSQLFWLSRFGKGWCSTWIWARQCASACALQRCHLQGVRAQRRHLPSEGVWRTAQTNLFSIAFLFKFRCNSESIKFLFGSVQFGGF